MLYLSLKVLHILSMVVLFGTGLGSAWYKWMADRSGDACHIARTNRQVVLADWIFTTPAIIIQPVTGFSMLYILDMPFTSTWVVLSLVLYLVAGACWLPVVWLQIRMKQLSAEACSNTSQPGEKYWQYAHAWFWLGVPAFSAMVMIVILMVFKFV